MSTAITVKATGLVYSNPTPHLRSIVAYHPSLTLIGENEFLATFDLGEAVEALNYHTVVSRSTDRGDTWQVEGRLLREPKPSTTHTIRTSRLRDGSVVGFGGLQHRADSDSGLINRRTFGYVPVEPFVVRSSDGGRSWSKPEFIETPLVGPSWETSHHILELKDGRWLAPIATWRAWDGDQSSGQQAVVFISDDRGRSWPSFGRTFDGRSSGILHLEQSVIQMHDERILALCWQHELQSGNNLPSIYSLSFDRGENFSPATETGFLAQTAKVIQLRDGRLLCIYRRSDRAGLWATVARIENDRWTNLDESPLWQGAESGMSGVLNSGEELSNLKFGYPSIRQISAHEVLVLFWCQEDCITHIRWIKLAVA
jgi:sialidase-1